MTPVALRGPCFAGVSRHAGVVRNNGTMSTSDEEPRIVAGRYRLRSVLGSGAMGTVWAAYDEFLQRMVAVKEVRLPPGVAASQADELRERTLREARAIAVLSHPNVIILHDVAREDGDPFVVMELLPSHSLAELLRDHGPLDVEQAAAMADAVAAALEAAHAAGITHRDVKPGNVLISSDGRIKLTDFGIARNVSEATMTRTGMMLGSPAYIAPEVASGRGSPRRPICGASARRSSRPSKAPRPTTRTATRWRPSARSCTARCRNRLPVRSRRSSKA